LGAAVLTAVTGQKMKTTSISVISPWRALNALREEYGLTSRRRGRGEVQHIISDCLIAVDYPPHVPNILDEEESGTGDARSNLSGVHCGITALLDAPDIVSKGNLATIVSKETSEIFTCGSDYVDSILAPHIDATSLEAVGCPGIILRSTGVQHRHCQHHHATQGDRYDWELQSWSHWRTPTSLWISQLVLRVILHRVTQQKAVLREELISSRHHLVPANGRDLGFPVI
jgi:hypothetical protein